jgi:hypothetical protein
MKYLIRKCYGMKLPGKNIAGNATHTNICCTHKYMTCKIGHIINVRKYVLEQPKLVSIARARQTLRDMSDLNHTHSQQHWWQRQPWNHMPLSSAFNSRCGKEQENDKIALTWIQKTPPAGTYHGDSFRNPRPHDGVTHHKCQRRLSQENRGTINTPCHQ